MRAFGIDYQRTRSIVRFCEGRWPEVYGRSVGDGRRRLIPHGVLDVDRWGSQAFAVAGEAPISALDSVEDGPWREDAAVRSYWRGLVERLRDYLGASELKDGIEASIVVAFQAAQYGMARQQLIALCRDAGVPEPICLPATNAILCRWMAEQTSGETGKRVVSAVAVGDTAVLVSSYEVELNGIQLPDVSPRWRHAYVPETGHALWEAELLALLRGHFTETPSREMEFLLRDAVGEFAMQWRGLPSHRLLEWQGIGCEHLQTAVRLSWGRCLQKEEMKRWSAVGQFAHGVTEAVRRTLSAVANRSEPDVLLVGGLGALWPFPWAVALELVSDPARVWRVDDPEESVARGAAWAPHLEGNAFGLLHDLMPALTEADAIDYSVPEVVRTEQEKETSPKQDRNAFDPVRKFLHQ